jgi:hypothetical protein
MKKLAFIIAVAVAFGLSGVAYAEMVEGTVETIDLAGKTFKVTKTEAATGATEELTVAVSDATTYAGEVTAFDELLEGDEVKIEAEKDAATGNWTAKSVEVPLIEVGEEETAEEAPEEAEAPEAVESK